MPLVTSKIMIKGDKDKIYALIKDMTSYPRFMKNLVQVEVLETNGRTDLTHWVSEVDGRQIVWTEKDYFYPEEYKITYAQTEGDLKKMTGAWTMSETPAGVEVVLTVDFEFGVPMLAGLLNPLLVCKVRENSQSMLAAMKAQIER